jgi:DNA-binding CsgD family transcriptional regulator
VSTQQRSDHPQPLALDDHAQTDALRFWLSSGIHKFAVDPRRRLGGHLRARQLLTQDSPPPQASAGAWQSLASTLDRHTVLGGMTELSSKQRRVIMLAYLEGCTNREIAIGLGVSVGTVRRLLQAALKQLETYLTRTGTWLYAVLLLGGGYAVDAATRLGRTAIAVRSPDWTYTLASTAAVGAVTVAAIGSTVVSPGSIDPGMAAPPPTVQAIAVLPSLGAKLSPAQRPRVPPAPATFVAAADRSHGQGRNDYPTRNQTTGANHTNKGNGQQGLARGPKQGSGESPDQGSPPDPTTQES